MHSVHQRPLAPPPPDEPPPKPLLDDDPPLSGELSDDDPDVPPITHGNSSLSGTEPGLPLRNTPRQ